MPPVLLLMIDGARPDAVERAHCPNMIALRARGASTMRAASVMPSVTLPCHVSIFHSVPPSRHGITTNIWVPMARPVPGLVDLASAAGLRAAFFHNWEPLRDLNRPGALHFSYFRDNGQTPGGDDVLAEEAARFVAAEQPDFMFVYFGTVDVAGHSHGWMSNEYLAQLERVDKGVGVLLDSLPNGYAVLLHSDHGGHERHHGTPAPEDMTIPWMIAGPGIKQNYSIESAVSLLDTAPTVARLLGFSPHAEWEGRCIDEVWE